MKFIYGTFFGLMLVGVAAYGFVIQGNSMQTTLLPLDENGYQTVRSLDDVYRCYPLTAQQIKETYEIVIQHVQKEIDAIIALSPEERSCQTVLYALDKADGYVGWFNAALELINLTSPEEEVRNVAAEYEQKIDQFLNVTVQSNVALYQALKAYAATGSDVQALTDAERYFLDEVLHDFVLSGLDLPADKLAQVVRLREQLSELGRRFQLAISQSNRTLEVFGQQLRGIAQDFIDSLEKTAEGNYILKANYPTQDIVLQQGADPELRKQFLRMMNQRGYPQNVETLTSIIALRHELANLIGFPTYADLALQRSMIGTVADALKFQEAILEPALKKAAQEFALLAHNLPEGVALTADGKFQPWDVAYTINHVKKKLYAVDEEEIAQYFPMEQTLQGLFNLYEQFFSIKFEEIKNPQAWHPEVRLIQVSSQNNNVLGYVFLDMFPRDNKYTHAAKFGCIASRLDAQGNQCPAVCALVCNFTPPRGDKPSLLKYAEVETFFHEFGHALHAILGATRLIGQAGTHVKRDFVEMPSQMLEEWLAEKEIIRTLSKHYKTGQRLPEHLIDPLLALKKVFNGRYETRQIQFGLLSLAMFDADLTKDLDMTEKQYQEKCLGNFITCDPEDKGYCSFGHLIGYGPKYYGYLWTRVLAADVFEQIRKEGMLNPAAGARYTQAILAPGGSKDPAVMVREYLGREPSQEPFLKRNDFI